MNPHNNHRISICKITEPASFGIATVIRIEGGRTLLKSLGNEEYKRHVPATMTHGELIEALQGVGKLGKMEEFVCPDTIRSVMRGWIEKDGREYFFYLVSDNDGQFLRADVNHTIEALALSGREVEKK